MRRLDVTTSDCLRNVRKDFHEPLDHESSSDENEQALHCEECYRLEVVKLAVEAVAMLVYAADQLRLVSYQRSFVHSLSQLNHLDYRM